MSDTEDLERRSVEDVREIERATERLEQTLERAREAVQRANRADSLSTPGMENAVPEPDPRDEEQDDDGRRDDDGGEDAERKG
ncbi:hypothetical protein [Actinospica sp.]|jgi:hypothetical protein|uniref:hypothetical protein n=1 Tax=Actinospica sp. TaxID=1872142 RepID=UPI002BE40CC4|nr:hypothetical protein [Actinospica sp.]HWG26133.1 hypothetical protein [Actinospica sp.]